MAKLMAPNETIWWVSKADNPDFDPQNPSASALTEDNNISCAITTGYTLNPTDSDTDDTSTICDNANVETPTFKNYEGNLQMIREELGESADQTSGRYKAWEFFKHKHAEGWLVRRVRGRNNDPAEVGQEVDSYEFLSDNPQESGEDDAALIMYTVNFHPQGNFAVGKELVA